MSDHDDEHLANLSDGAGCAEVWEHLSAQRAEVADADADDPDGSDSVDDGDSETTADGTDTDTAAENVDTDTTVDDSDTTADDDSDTTAENVDSDTTVDGDTDVAAGGEARTDTTVAQP